MPFEGSTLAKSSGTIWTGIGSFSGMCPLVVGQRGAVSVLSWAVGTAIRFFSKMFPEMGPEMDTLVEGFGTEVTLVSSLACMNLGMFLVYVHFRESLVAVLALE